MSHDLKSPLRGIKQLAAWLVEDNADCFDQEGKTMVELLMNRVQHMDKLIDGILKYSRVGRVLGIEERVDSALLLEGLLEMIAPPDALTMTLGQPLPVVFADRMRLTQIFQNLLENAIKFMDKPDGKITVSCLDQGSFWQFCVADNGPGIAAEEHERIFQIFQTLRLSHEEEGSGIGLALVKKSSRPEEKKFGLNQGRGKVASFILP